MLKVYIIISLITTGLCLLTGLRMLNKNIRELVKKYGKLRTSKQRILQEIKDLIRCWIPIYNIILAGLFIYLLFAPELIIIKLLSNGIKKAKSDQIEIEKYLDLD